MNLNDWKNVSPKYYKTMKKLLLISMMCLMALMMRAQRCAVLDFQLGTNVTAEATAKTIVPAGYIDLGLPSGTLWKSSNVTGFYTYDEAVRQFGGRLPTEEQWQELRNKCRWSWNGSGYKITGPNGNSIVLPASGFRRCNRSVEYVGISGFYWTSTPYYSYNAYCFSFNKDVRTVPIEERCIGGSVRLVQD